MLRVLEASDHSRWRHYLYGSSPEVLEAIRRRILEVAPAAVVVGAKAPPFRPLTTAEEDVDVAAIRASKADIVWVGLGMPKQELWMHRVRDRLPGVALIGVGAAFDFLAGTKKQAPGWMQRSGLEWLYRLVHEPRRLWKRYIWNNPAYLMLAGYQVVTTQLRRRARGGSRSG